MEEINTTVVESEETMEVAEPSVEPEESGAEVQETAEPESTGKTEADSAFAEMRRRAEEAERRAEEAERNIAEREAEAEARRKAYQNVLGDNVEDVEMQALADAYGVTVDEIQNAINEAEAEQEEEAERRKIEEERDYYKNLYQESEFKARSEADIAAIKKAFPEEAKDLNTFEDLAKTCGTFMNAEPTLTAEEAFAAYLMVKERTVPKPPKEIGEIGKTPENSGFISREEAMAMTEEEQRRNAPLILESQKRW